MKFTDEDRNDPRHKKRDLTEVDYSTLGIPKDLWSVQFAGIQEENKAAVGNFLRNLVPLVRRGYGMWLVGESGVGKSAIAAILAKAATAYRFRTYFTNIPDLRDRIVSKAEYMEGVTFLDRARTCDFLVIDDLNEYGGENRFFGYSDLRDLVRKRVAETLSTVVTTAMPPPKISQLLFDAFTSSQHRMPVLVVKGRDLYEARVAEAASIFED